MFKHVRTYTSVAYAEPQEELFDQFGDVYQASWSDIQHCSPLDNRSSLTYTQARRVAGMTKAGGNPFTMILRQQGVKAQYASLLIKWKVMGLDRPTVRKFHRLNMEDRANIVADYAAGLPVKDIQVKYDCADSQIYRSMRVLETNISRRCDQVQITAPEKSNAGHTQPQQSCGACSCRNVTIWFKYGYINVNCFVILMYQRLTKDFSVPCPNRSRAAGYND